MSNYGSIDLPDCWGIDTAMAGVLTDEQLRALRNTPLPASCGGEAPFFLWGYIPLPGNAKSDWDWSASSIRRACDAGFICLCVQHCRKGTTLATPELGRADGDYAAEYASGLGYPADCHVALDDEAVRNPGQDAIDRNRIWCSVIRQAALPCVYEGYAPGLTPDEQYALPTVDRYWGAYGPWEVATRGVCCRQGLQITHAGVGVDPDLAFPDKLGGVLRGMCRLDMWPQYIQTADPAA